MYYKQRFNKAEVLRWSQFSRHGDAIFLTLKREVLVGVLSVATLTAACPDSSAARMSTASSSPHAADEDSLQASALEDSSPIDISCLETGDLLFNVVSPTRDGVAAAIVDVTEGYDLQRVSHVAIVCIEADGTIFALEASSAHGVWLNPIDSFLVHSDHSPQGLPLVLVGRLKDQSSAAASVSKAKAYIGRPYDHQYLPGDSALYCSELLHYSYTTSDGTPIFPQQPMSFHDKSGQVTPFWVDYYRRWNMEVPEGWPGTNPGALSKSHAIDIIGRFF